MLRRTSYSQLITYIPQLTHLNDDRVRELNGELSKLDLFIETLPVSI